MPSLRGSIQPRAEAGRKAQPRCVYCCAFAPVDPTVPAKVIGTRVVLLLLGALSLRSGFPASRETCASCVSTFTRCASTGLPGCLLLRGAKNFRLRGEVGGREWQGRQGNCCSQRLFLHAKEAFKKTFQPGAVSAVKSRIWIFGPSDHTPVWKIPDVYG